VIRIYAMFFRSKAILFVLLLSFLAVSVCSIIGLVPTSTGKDANLWMKLLMTQSIIYFAVCVACDAIVIACAWTDNLTLMAFGASLTTLNIYLLAPRLLISFRSYHSKHSRSGSANDSLGLSSRSSTDRDIQLQSFGRESRTSSVLKLPMGTWEAITG